jgi:alanine dehydrogenase
MPPIYITFLNRLDIEELALSDEEILAAIETSLAAQGRGQTVIEPRVHLAPGQSNGHFNVLRGAIAAPVDRAGIKVVGDFVDNYKLGFPSELGVVLLLDPRTGAPQAILDGAGITDMRTGAMTAVGAKYLARKNSRILGHIGARGSAYWNVRLLDHLFDFDEIRVHSKRPESRNGFAERLVRDLGKKVTATADWRSCVEGADIVVEASRLMAPEPLLKTEWIKPAAFVVPYGTMSAVELSLTDIASKLVVDDWGQSVQGRSVRQPAGPCQRRQAFGGDPACRDGPDRRRPETRPGARRRDDHLLAPRTVSFRHRARPCHDREEHAARHRPEIALLLTSSLLGARHSSGASSWITQPMSATGVARSQR